MHSLLLLHRLHNTNKQQQRCIQSRMTGMSAAALGSSSSSANSMNPPVMSMQGAGSLLNRQHQQLLAAQRQTAMLQQQSAMLRAQSPQFRAGVSPSFNSPGYRSGYQLPVSVTQHLSCTCYCASSSTLRRSTLSVVAVLLASSK
jgi:hypothetical protein